MRCNYNKVRKFTDARDYDAIALHVNIYIANRISNIHFTYWFIKTIMSQPWKFVVNDGKLYASCKSTPIVGAHLNKDSSDSIKVTTLQAQ